MTFLPWPNWSTKAPEGDSLKGNPIPVRAFQSSHPDPSPGRPPLGSLPSYLCIFRVLTEVLLEVPSLMPPSDILFLHL